MIGAKAVGGALAAAVVTGAILAGPSALDALRDTTLNAPGEGISRTDREQARNVVRAWRMNGGYSECITALGYDGVLWQSTIGLAAGLADDPALAALYEDIRAREGDDTPQWTRQFEYDSNDCRRQNPEQRTPPEFERVKDWPAIIAEAREHHGWSPDDPFALDCESHPEATLAACRTWQDR